MSLGLAANTALIASLLAGGASSSAEEQRLADAHMIRRELAGWLRGTEACRAGRVARRLAELLRERGVEAEAHPAGKGGGYAVATIGPSQQPISALLVAQIVSCPTAPVAEELEWDRPAQAVWRAAALAAALRDLAEGPGRRTRRVRVLFLAGDASGACGRGFVSLAYPHLAEGAPVLEVGGRLLVRGGAAQVVLGAYRPRQVRLWLRVRDSERRPGDQLDRSLALADGFTFTAPPTPEVRATLVAQGDRPAPAVLTESRCWLGPRVDRQTAEIACRLAPAVSVEDLGFALHQRLANPAVVISWPRQPLAKPARSSPPVDRALQRATRSVFDAPARIVRGVERDPRCGGEPGLAAGALGVALVPAAADSGADLAHFEQAVHFSRALVEQLIRPDLTTPESAANLK